jgi:hypothetical protein
MEEKIVGEKKESSLFSFISFTLLSIIYRISLICLHLHCACARPTTPLWFTDNFLYYYLSPPLQTDFFNPVCARPYTNAMPRPSKTLYLHRTTYDLSCTTYPVFVCLYHFIKYICHS